MGLFSRFIDPHDGYSNSNVRVASTDYTFFSVETPNRANDAICSIGVIKTDAVGTLKYKRGFLVHPEEPFDRRNTEVNGVALGDVADEPPFDEIWRDELAEVFAGTVLVSFDARFNMLVLNKTLQRYGLRYPSDRFIDVQDLARDCLTRTDDLSLGAVCRQLGIEMPRRRSALGNALACEQVYRALVRKAHVEDHRGRHYYWKFHDLKGSRRTPACSQAMAELYGICLGIAFDVPINEGEIACIRDWMTRNAAHRRTPYFSECYDLIEKVLADGMLSLEEHEQLLDYTRPFVFDRSSAVETVDQRQLIGVLRGTISDGDISANEAAELASWLDERREFLSDPNIAHLYDVVAGVRRRGEIEPEENVLAMRLSELVISADRRDHVGKIIVGGRRFCLTGEFGAAPRHEVERAIIAAGGEVASVVTRGCSYVVMGDLGFDGQGAGVYGPKVRKAIELQQHGFPVQVIMESDLLRALGY